MKNSSMPDRQNSLNSQKSEDKEVSENKKKMQNLADVPQKDLPSGNRSQRIPTFPNSKVKEDGADQDSLQKLGIKGKALSSLSNIKISAPEGASKDENAVKQQGVADDLVTATTMDKPVAKKGDRLVMMTERDKMDTPAEPRSAGKINFAAMKARKVEDVAVKTAPVNQSVDQNKAEAKSTDTVQKDTVQKDTAQKEKVVTATPAAPAIKVPEEKNENRVESPRARKSQHRKPRPSLKGKTSVGVKPAISTQAEDALLLDAADDGVLMLTPSNFVPIQRPKVFEYIGYAAMTLTGLWVGYCLVYGLNTFDLSSLSTAAPHEVGGFLAALFVPPLLLWMVISNMRRDADIQLYAQSLREELQSIIFPSEEKTQRASKDIQVLSKQAAELSMASKDTLRNLAKARQGMRAEIRDFVGLSKKAEFHIDRLSEVLQGKTERLSGVMDSIEGKTTTIDANTEKGVAAWQAASQKMFATVADIESRLAKGAEALAGAAERTDEKAQMVEERFQSTAGRFDTVMDGVVVRMNDVSSNFDMKKVDIESIADSLMEKASSFASTLEGQKSGFENVAVKATETLSVSLERIEAQYEALDQNAKDIASQTDEIVQRVERSVETLAVTSEDLRGKVEVVRESLVGQTEGLKEAVLGLTSNIEKIEVAGDNAAHKLTEAVDVALSGSDRLTLSIRRAVDNLNAVSNESKEEADRYIKLSDEQLERIVQAQTSNKDTAQTVADVLENTYDKLSSIGSFVDEQVEKLAQAFDGEVGKFDDSSRALTRRLTALQHEIKSPLLSLREALDEVKEEHEGFVGVFDERIGELGSATDKALSSAENIKTMLRDEVVEISTLTGQLNNDADVIAEKLSDNTEHLRTEVAEAVQNLDSVTDRIVSKSDILRDVSADNVKALDMVEETIETNCTEVKSYVSATLESLGSLERDLQFRTENLCTETEKAKQGIQSVTDSVEATMDSVCPAFDDVLSRAGNVELRFKTLNSDFEEQTQTYLEWYKDAGSVFEDSIESIRQNTDKVTVELTTAASALTDRYEEVGDIAEESLKTVKILDASLDSQQSNVHLVVDNTVAKIKALQKDMNEHVEESSATMGQSLSQIKSVLSTLDETSAGVRSLSNETVDALERVEKTMTVKSENLVELTTDFEGKTTSFFDMLDDRAGKFVDDSKDHFLSLQRVSDSFSIRIKELERHINATVESSKAYTEELKSESRNVSGMTMEVTDKVSMALSSLSSKIEGVQKLSQSVANDITSANKTLAEQSDGLLRVSSKVEQAASDVSERFLKQTDKLFDIVEQARSQTDNMKLQTARVQRDQFMNAAKFIVESLHSMSVDLTRIIDGKVSERIWKSYQAGDVSVFTERLASLDMDVMDEKLRTKYADDQDFRNYVQKFIRQYEELNIQALENDYGDLLASTFRSSDVGKLYTLLCYAAGRDKKAA